MGGTHRPAAHRARRRRCWPPCRLRSARPCSVVMLQSDGRRGGRRARRRHRAAGRCWLRWRGPVPVLIALDDLPVPGRGERRARCGSRCGGLEPHSRVRAGGHRARRRIASGLQWTGCPATGCCRSRVGPVTVGALFELLAGPPGGAAPPADAAAGARNVWWQPALRTGTGPRSGPDGLAPSTWAATAGAGRA